MANRLFTKRMELHNSYIEYTKYDNDTVTIRISTLTRDEDYGFERHVELMPGRTAEFARGHWEAWKAATGWQVQRTVVHCPKMRAELEARREAEINRQAAWSIGDAAAITY